ncbi:MAG: carboxypeptidase-like regulatory domain-containing protein [Sphingomonadales bacterium]|nr:carboxypeptidase-like regulatory domain-containing protein [Sphingomonadales bacterium]
MKPIFLGLFCFLISPAFGQQTIVSGRVTDKKGEPLSDVNIQFLDSKISTRSDSLGNFYLSTYYPTDTLLFRLLGYQTQRIKINKDKNQELVIKMPTQDKDIAEIILKAPTETRGSQLHRRIITYKDVNNKEKLSAYQCHLYNKIELDASNLDSGLLNNPIVNRLDLVKSYLQTDSNNTSLLPVILSESVSDYYYRKDPKLKKEVVGATKITGVENMQMTPFLGDMYLELNIYDNIYDLFNKSFISPLAPYARSYYQFYLDDSTFIGSDWCYKLRFVPKRSGDLVFEGHMWIHDTTYAVKRIEANIAPGANLNYIQEFYFEQSFEQVQKEVWMLTEENMVLSFKVTEKSKFLGLIGRKYSRRSTFMINQPHEEAFYRSENAVEVVSNAKTLSNEEWEKMRPIALSTQETQIQAMVDSLEAQPFYQNMRKLTYFATTGYWPIQKIELGSAASLVSVNPVEKFRMSLALRTSNDFSKRLELGGRIAYGFGDERFKYNVRVRYNITPQKRGMLNAYYNYDIEQIGQSPTAASMGTSFVTFLSTAPFDKLTFVQKAGLSLEKDIKKDLIVYTAAEWKNYTPLGLATYQRLIGQDTIQLSNLTAAEFTTRIRWTKDEEFLSGSFDRTALRSPYPILSFQGVFGIKGILGSEYNYQKFEFQYEHNTQLGVLGRMRYGFTLGYINGSTAYPLLKVHEGNQSVWLLTSTFNMVNFIEFVSDRYVIGFAENRWEGLIFDRIPLVKASKIRLITTERFMLGGLSSKHADQMLIPEFVRPFNGIPYIEVGVGIENILKVIRIDVVYRATHQIPGVSPIGIKARYSLNF